MNIVLIQGILGFDLIELKSRYFCGVRDHFTRGIVSMVGAWTIALVHLAT